MVKNYISVFFKKYIPNCFTYFSDTLSLNMVVDDSKSHVLPKVINALSNAIASTFDLPSISVINQPFKGESFDAGFDGGLFAGAMFFGFTYVFLVMQQGMELIYDREVNQCYKLLMFNDEKLSFGKIMFRLIYQFMFSG